MKTTGDYVLTPQGRVHKSRIHHVGPNGEAGPPGPTSGRSPGDSVVRAVSPNGWKASATFAAAVPLGKMSVKFTVPELPTVDGAIIFLFAGAENAQMKMILQPVLQWGLFGIDGWTIACWFVSPDGHWMSNPEPVSPGETVTGKLEAVQCSADACMWMIEASTSKVSTALNWNVCPALVLKPLMLFLVGGALEAYPTDPCCTGLTPEQYPASGATTFYDIKLKDLAGHRFVADWNARCVLDKSGCDCKNTVEISRDKRTVTLNY